MKMLLKLINIDTREQIHCLLMIKFDTILQQFLKEISRVENDFSVIFLLLIFNLRLQLKIVINFHNVCYVLNCLKKIEI